jgi:bifunctional non-homologous end joining protein LigD
VTTYPEWASILSAAGRDALAKKRQPDFIAPMKATLTRDYFDDPDWIYERKLDGVRALLTRRSGDVALYSRNRKRLDGSFPEITEAVGGLPLDLIADSELVTFDGKVTSFARLQGRIHVNDPDEELIGRIPVIAYLFDLLFLDGYDLREVPLRERKKVLKAAIDYHKPLRYLPHRNEQGIAYHDAACRKGWEGVIAKEAGSAYSSERSHQWLKFKCSAGQELVIGGFTEPSGSRIGFGALLLGYYDGDNLHYAGRVGTGFSDDMLRLLHWKLKKLKRETSPFTGFADGEEVTWVSPQLVGEIGFTEWTQDGRLRHPRFLGLREDKPAEDVVREA